MSTTIYTLNRCPIKVVEEKTPYEAWERKKPNKSHLRIFYYKKFSFIVLERKKQLDDKYEKCIFVVYDSQHRGYRIYSPYSNAVFVLRYMKFKEDISDSSSKNSLKILQNYLSDWRS